MITPGFTLKCYNNKRSGVILYTVKNKELYFLVGIDRKTREFTDFGGGCKQPETLLDSAIRELHEETCGIFSNVITKKDLENSIAVTNQSRDTAIFFVYVPNIWIDKAEPLFKNKINFNDELENIGVKWLKDSDFGNIAFNKKSQCMWGRVQKFLMNNVNYTELRVCLIIRLLCKI